MRIIGRTDLQFRFPVRECCSDLKVSIHQNLFTVLDSPALRSKRPYSKLGNWKSFRNIGKFTTEGAVVPDFALAHKDSCEQERIKEPNSGFVLRLGDFVKVPLHYLTIPLPTFPSSHSKLEQPHGNIIYSIVQVDWLDTAIYLLSRHRYRCPPSHCRSICVQR